MNDEFERLADDDAADERNDQPRGPSKSQVKRELHALQALGARLMDMPAGRLKGVVISDKLAAALEEGRSISAHGARKRHMKHVGKLLRGEDHQAIAAFVAQLDSKHASSNRQFHQLENWRDRLIDEGDDALGEWLTEFPDSDRQQLRQLIRSAQRERAQERPPVAARKLFKYLRQQSGL